MTGSDALLVLGIAVSCVLLVGALGLLVLARLRHLSVRVQVVGGPVVVLLALALAVWVDTRVMFLSPHDSCVVALTLATALPVALALSAWLGEGVSRSARSLAAAARGLGEGVAPHAEPLVSTELADVSRELADAGRRLAVAREQEADLERSRRDLITWVSHDLRTPLAGIRAMAEALEDGVAEDPGSYHKQLGIEANRLSGMVDTLFLLSRLHSGTLRPVREPMPVDDLVSDAVAAIRPVADARRVRVDGASEDDVVASVDAAQLSRALVNLLTNAVRHTPAGGTVGVDTRRRGGDEVVVTVQDQCGGIADADLPRVFDVGWRGEDARLSGPDGRGGHGLAVARGVVEAHGGSVRVVNVDGGCRFVVSLPRSAASLFVVGAR